MVTEYGYAACISGSQFMTLVRITNLKHVSVLGEGMAGLSYLVKKLVKVLSTFFVGEGDCVHGVVVVVT